MTAESSFSNYSGMLNEDGTGYRDKGAIESCNLNPQRCGDLTSRGECHRFTTDQKVMKPLCPNLGDLPTSVRDRLR